jgi:hypothetical protein
MCNQISDFYFRDSSYSSVHPHQPDDDIRRRRSFLPPPLDATIYLSSSSWCFSMSLMTFLWRLECLPLSKPGLVQGPRGGRLWTACRSICVGCRRCCTACQGPTVPPATTTSLCCCSGCTPAAATGSTSWMVWGWRRCRWWQVGVEPGLGQPGWVGAGDGAVALLPWHRLDGQEWGEGGRCRTNGRCARRHGYFSWHHAMRWQQRLGVRGGNYVQHIVCGDQRWQGWKHRPARRSGPSTRLPPPG